MFEKIDGSSDEKIHTTLCSMQDKLPAMRLFRSASWMRCRCLAGRAKADPIATEQLQISRKRSLGSPRS
jgi:hypothetical protein